MSHAESLDVVIVGGSIGGLSTAHACLKAGCKVTIFERAREVKEAGAGLGLDAHTCAALAEWGFGQALEEASHDMPTETNRVVDHHTRQASLLFTDDTFDNKSLHWGGLHRFLYESLPEGVIHFSHEVSGYEEVEVNGRPRVKVFVEGMQSPQEADVLVAADGSKSQTRSRNVPKDSVRYCGYCAWRGVLAEDTDPQVAHDARQAYGGLPHTLYFDIAENQHTVLYELPGGRLNWLWYVNQPEPKPVGHSVTLKATDSQIESMRKDAEKLWTPAMSKVMQATPAPFLNAIYDHEPLKQWVFGRVVLLGEAAHATSPHGLRSTNMSILDAHQLGRSMRDARTPEEVDRALQEYQDVRLPVTTREVLFSRYLGQLKQGLRQAQGGPSYADFLAMDQRTAHELLAEANMKTFDPALVPLLSSPA